jgi:unsaturated chondroitin disaccharide hydrolase
VPVFHGALDFATAQAERLIATYPDYSPMYTVGGKWNREGERWTHWCEGFFPGLLWLVHQHTGAAKWRTWAEQYSRGLAPRQYDRNVHDLGFIFGLTYLRWFTLTRDPALRDVLIQAGRTLAQRRQTGGYLASFLGPHSLFIDIMMNVPLVLWAANETGDAELRAIALEHCRVTERTLVRADGGTAHEGLFETGTGQFLRQSTQQGWKPESTWSRGQAWALYGFTIVARLAGSDGAEFLHTARRCADFWLRRAPGGTVPRWDFDVPDDGNQPFDSSAAAIACSGLIDLANLMPDQADSERYLLAALATLETLCSDSFLARSQPEWEGILRHGVYHKHKGLGVDESVAWGDYFFVEALVQGLDIP